MHCEHGGRRITRTEYDGSITVVMDRFEGKRLNSPNDVIVASDGAIWFTDPVFGISGNYKGYKADPELPQNVYRIDGQTGEATVVADDVLGPNGLCFSPDESILYIVESRGEPTRKILAYDVVDGVKLTGKRIHIDAGAGTPDGIRCDVDGNLWCGWGMGGPALDGVMIYADDGDLIGRIALPERCANVCFGGRANSRLFMAASHSVYALYVNVAGVKGGVGGFVVTVHVPIIFGPGCSAMSPSRGDQHLAIFREHPRLSEPFRVQIPNFPLPRY